MKKIKNILLYVGGDVSPFDAIERATALACGNGAKLTLVDVLPKASASSWMTPPSWPEQRSGRAAARHDELEELARPIRHHGLEVEVCVLLGEPSVELIHRVHRVEHDLVIKTAQGSDGFLGGIFGSTAQHLLRRCPCPVWVIKPGEAACGRVIAAIDPNLEHPEKDALSRSVLECAAALAKSRDLELDVVHAWWLSEPMHQDRFGAMAPETAAEIVEETRDATVAAVQKLVETVDLSDVVYQVHVTLGAPLDVISAFSQQAEVAVLGTHARTGIAGVLIGNTVERILRQLDCSVLAVKPGFDPLHPVSAENLERCA